MKRMFFPLILAAAAGPAAAIQAQGSNPPGGRQTGAGYTVKLNPSERRGTVAPGIFGHMVEMIGTTIYDGIWVGEDSSIPNDGGCGSTPSKPIANSALPRFAGRGAPLPTPTAGRTGSDLDLNVPAS